MVKDNSVAGRSGASTSTAEKQADGTGFRYRAGLHELTAFGMLAMIPWTLWMFASSPMWIQVLMYAVVVPFCGELIRLAGMQFGDSLSRGLTAAGIVAPGAGGKHPLADPAVRTKWRRQFWQLTVHATFTAVEFYFLFLLPLSDSSWPNLWENPSEAFVPLPAAQDPLVPEALKHFMIIQIWVWNYTAMYHLFLDAYNKDYYETAIHHIATVTLVGFAGAMGYYKIGLLVLFINDGVDTSVDMLRITNFLKLRGAQAFFIVEVTLFAMAGHFFYWRLWLAPGLILDTVKEAFASQCTATSAVVAEVHGTEALTYEPSWAEEARCFQEVAVPSLLRVTQGEALTTWEVHTLTWFGGHFLLALLNVLHVVWMYFIGRVIYRAVTAGTESGSKDYEGSTGTDAEEVQTAQGEGVGSQLRQRPVVATS